MQLNDRIKAAADRLWEFINPEQDEYYVKLPDAQKPTHLIQVRARCDAYGVRIITAIDKKDWNILRNLLEPRNKASRAVFLAETGIVLHKNLKETREQARAFCGDEIVQAFESEQAEKQRLEDEKWQQDCHQRRSDAALSKQVRRSRTGVVMTKKEFIDELIAEGYTTAKHAKRGSFPILQLWNADNVFYTFRVKIEIDYALKRIAEVKAQKEMVVA
jgi:hypothetical protein